MTAMTQAVAKYTPSKAKPLSHQGSPTASPSPFSPGWTVSMRSVASIPDGALAPSIVDPEDRGEYRQHHRETQPPARQQCIQGAVDVETGLLEPSHLNLLGDLLRGSIETLADPVVKISGKVPP